MKILAVGDIVGATGRKAAKRWLPELIDEIGASFVVVNVENIYNGRGVDRQGAREILSAGADCLTSGNHVWALRDHAEVLESEPALLRPANYPSPCPGRGSGVFTSRDGVRVGVLNLIGRVFLSPVDDPFRAADRWLEEIRPVADVTVVDFHAEATSEKTALGRHLDGRASVVFGTHTHVQTADARVLPGGTGYITDLGMTGPHDSVIGMEPAAALARFLGGRPQRAQTATGAPGLRGAWFDVDETSGRCRRVERVVRGEGGR